MDTIVDQPEWAHERLVWRICLTPIHVLGILASIYRITRRRKTRQSGLDDYAATLALILDLIFFPTLWLRNGDADQEVPSAGLSTTVANRGLLGDDLPADLETRIVQVVIGWVVQIVYPLLTWSAKASLALSISRLIPKFYFTYKASIVVACLSALIGLGIVIQTSIFCTTGDKTWTLVPPYRCTVTNAAGIFRGGSEVVVDIFLILIPFCAFFFPTPSFSFRLSPATLNQPSPGLPININPPLPARPRLGLPPVTRRLIQICFLASLLTTSTAIAIVIVLFKYKNSTSPEIQARTGYMAFVLTHLTGSVSLLVCNVLIVITSLYRLLRTPPPLVEVGKSPVIPSISTQENSESESSTTSNGTGGSERATTSEGNESETGGGGGGGSGSSYPKTAASSTSTRIELTEIYESDLSFA